MAASMCSSCSAFSPSLLAQVIHAVELKERLQNNDYQSQFEAAHCQAIISSSTAELELYDSEIHRVRQVLHQLEVDRVAVQEYSQLCRSMLAPIRRLPSEILVEIFTLFLAKSV
ncbi:hypothetical protein C8R43DRAFT_1021444 [Mycena crocata]|nr:hypothetical protein C8R43DRAFT_1021444 [Mycena crocata]